MGLRFFSRLPTGDFAHEAPSLDRMAPALGLVSLLVGFGPAVVLAGGSWLGLSPLLAAVLAVAALVLATGAMAEDALADSFDGLWGGHDTARRLEIMHDSRHGTYGVSAMVLFLVARVAAVSSLVLVSPLAGAAMWLAAQVLARQSSIWLAFRLPPARADGAGRSAGAISAVRYGFGAGLAILLVLILAGPGAGLVGVIFGIFFAVLTVVLWSRLCMRKVNGFTGDLIGGVQALVEIAVLCAFILFI